MTVCADGKVISCEQMLEREEDYLGDLRVQSIKEVWQSRKLDEYLIHPPREKLIGTACYDCDQFDECQTVMGLCVREAVKAYGTRWAPVPLCQQAPPAPRER